jgi:ABC-type multidrug transport system fused ATPase/permease subunit
MRIQKLRYTVAYCIYLHYFQKQINGTEGEIIIRESELWPTSGEIRFENLSLRYRDNTDDILHDISIHIQPGEKIGIIGRTGSGKFQIVLTINFV